MFYSLLDIVKGEGEKAGNWYFDNFGEALLYALIGFAVVFLGIVLLIAIIWLVGLLMRKTNNLEFLTNLKFKKRVKTEEVEQVAALQENTQADGDEIPAEVKAAIVAAIMAYYQQEESKCEFTVKRIKRI